MSGHVFLWVFPVWGIHWVSWICRFMYVTKFGEFSAIIYLNSFSIPYSFSSPSETQMSQMTRMSDCLFLSHSDLKLCSFSSLYFFPSLLFRQNNFDRSIFKFTDFLLYLHSAIEFIKQFIKIIFFSSKISTCSPLWLLFFFAQSFYFSAHFKNTHDCLLEQFYKSCFEVFVR